MFVFGDDYFGRVDSVPGLFSVKTRFLHIWWFPLIPRESYVFLDGDQTPGRHNGVRVPLRWKSVFFAWLQTSSLIVIVLMLFGGGALFTLEAKGFNVHPAILGVAAWTIAVLSGCLFWLTCRYSTANVPRARALALLVGLPEDEIERRLNPNGQTASDVATGRMSGLDEGYRAE